MKTIIVTGTPGTGKTTFSKKLARKMEFYYFDVNESIAKNRLYDSFDKKRNTKIVDINKLNKHIINEINSIKKYNKNKKSSKKFNGIIVDSHLSHYLPRKYVDFCIVTKCNIKELSKRLGKKKFNKNKIKENLQAEIFDICHQEAIEGKHNVMVIDTSKDFNINEIAKRVGD